jgi:hypothetical protein
MLNGYCDIHHDDDDNSSPVNGQFTARFTVDSSPKDTSMAPHYLPSFYSDYNQQPPQQQHDNTIQNNLQHAIARKNTLIIADNFHTDCWKGWHFSATHEVISFHPFLFLTSSSSPHASLELDHPTPH